MPTLYLTRGAPASGKTTFAKEWVAESPTTRSRVNRDDLRFMLDPDNPGILPHEMEEQVTKAQHSLVLNLLRAGRDVIVDDTNLRAKTVTGFYKLWPEVEVIDFQVPFIDLLQRDNDRRFAGQRAVGPSVLEMFFERFHIDRATGKLPKLPERTADLSLEFTPYVETPGLPSAIIVDIDGTLAHMVNRGPYDTSRYHTDEFDLIIGDLASVWRERTGAKLIVMSGRDEGFREVTEAWLSIYQNGFIWDEFYMRPQNDTRNDAIVKNELFETHVAGRYNIDFVLDDRDRVVEMWRAKGIKTLQVAPGDF